MYHFTDLHHLQDQLNDPHQGQPQPAQLQDQETIMIQQMETKETAIQGNSQPDQPLLNNLVLQVIQRLTVLNELEMELVIR